MTIAGIYSFNEGQAYIAANHRQLLTEVEAVIARINAGALKTKKSREKTMKGRLLYNPTKLNKAFKKEFSKFSGWAKKKEICVYPTKYYSAGYKPKAKPSGKRRPPDPYREMDFLKNKLGVEIQFGKYAFMVYNVCAKMTIFNNLGHIDAGIEVVPIKQFADEMSTGVSYFEQFVWDLEQRGVADIDIPVLVLGIDV